MLHAEEEWFYDGLVMEAPLRRYTALQELTLSAFTMRLAPAGGRLPPNLTKLVLAREFERMQGLQMNKMLKPLTRLVHLSLVGVRGQLDLSRMTGLRRLALRNCDPPPAGLPPDIQALSLAIEPPLEYSHDPIPASEQSVMALAQPHLESLASLLTYLALRDLRPGTRGHALLAALTRLTCLETFVCLALPQQLPSGAWLGGLHSLALPLGVAMASLEALGSAARLQSMCLVDLDELLGREGIQGDPYHLPKITFETEPRVIAELGVLECVARLPAMRQLAMCSAVWSDLQHAGAPAGQPQQPPLKAAEAGEQIRQADAACWDAHQQAVKEHASVAMQWAMTVNPHLSFEPPAPLFVELTAQLPGRRQGEEV